MADWKGRGGGRKAYSSSYSYGGGAGQGSGRPGAQPSVSISGGAGKGSGRPGSQPSLDIKGGAGKGGGRGGSQPSLAAAVSYSMPERSWSLKAAVSYGGSSSSVKKDISAGDDSNRAGSTIKAASGEKNPRVADPEGNFVFTLEIDGIEVAQFKECSGLKSSTQVFELEEGGVNHLVHKLPGQSRWDNITLRAGVTSSTDLMKWRDEVLQDEYGKRRNGSVVLKTLAMEEVRRFNFVEAWPVTWEGPTFDAGGADLAIETLEIAHHGIYAS